VRHRLLPIIAEEFGEAAIEHMGELAEIARAEEECWEPSTQYPVSSTQYTAFSASGAKFDVGRLLALPLAVQRRQVRAWIEANAPELKISFRLIEDALDLAGEPAGRKMEMSSGWNLRRGRQELLLESEADQGPSAAADYQYKLPVPGAVEIPELRVRIEAQVIDSGEFPSGSAGSC